MSNITQRLLKPATLLLLFTLIAAAGLSVGAPEASAQSNDPRMLVKNPFAGVFLANGDSSPSVSKGTDFGQVTVTGGARGDISFQILNQGQVDLILTGSPKVTISGSGAADFTVNSQPSSPVPFEGFTVFRVFFEPTQTGLRHATVSIANNDPAANPFTFAIQGTGSAQSTAEIQVESAGPDHWRIDNGDTAPSTRDGTDFGSVAANSGQKETTFSIVNNGTAPLELTGNPRVAITGAAASDFSVTSQPKSPLTGSEKGDFAIRFSPTAEGLRHATVTIESNDPRQGVYTFAIQGNGTPGPKPHISVTGNAHTIANGSSSPSAADNTDFGSATSNSGAVKQTFQVMNSGTADLNLTGTPEVAISGGAAGDFAVTTTPSSPLAANGQSALEITFTPSAEGLRHATVSIASNDSYANPYTFAIQGTGTPQPKPQMAVTGSQHAIASGDTSPSAADGTDFGSAVSGSGTVDNTFTIKNSGNAELDLSGTPKVEISGAAAGDFTVTVEPGSPLAPNHTTPVTIRFAPSAEGVRHATVSIANNDANPYTFAIQGTGTAQPKPDMFVAHGAHIIVAGDTTPSAVDNTDFGAVIVGNAPVDHSFAIYNQGNGDLVLNGTPKVSISGAAASDFTVITEPGTPIAYKQNSIFQIRFTPSVEGLRHATVSIANNDPTANPYTFAIQGTGTALPKPQMSITHGSHAVANGDMTPSVAEGTDFGSTTQGLGLVEREYQIHNGGTADLTLPGPLGIQISGSAAGDFSVKWAPTPSDPIKPGQTGRLLIDFTPSATGLRHAVVSIPNNDPSANPYTFAVQGAGTALPAAHIAVTGNSHPINNGDTTPSIADFTDFGGIATGSVDREFHIINLGGVDLELTGTPKVAISGAAAGDFTVVTQPGSSIGRGNKTIFVIRFSPSADGLRHATVSIASNDGARNPFTFAIQGTGTGQPKPHMAVTHGSHAVANGDMTPSVAEGTDLGSTTQGSGQVESEFQIHNAGTADLTLPGPLGIQITGSAAGDFSVKWAPSPSDPIAPGQTGRLLIDFTPSATGQRHAVVSIPNNDPSANPYTFAVQGTGTALAAAQIVVTGNNHPINNGDTTPSVADFTDFGSTSTGNVDREFHIINLGGVDLELTGTPKVAISGAAAGDFTVVTQPGSPIGRGNKTIFVIRFSPSADGLRHATVSIASNDGARNPFTFAIQGTGAAQPEPQMSVIGNQHTIANGDTSPSKADNTHFGSAVDGAPGVAHTFSIQNQGTADLDLTGTPKVSISGAAAGDFMVTAQPASVVTPNTHTIFTIRFTPSAVGPRHATVSISSNDAARSPYTFAIEGRGTAQQESHVQVLGNQHVIANGDGTPSTSDNTDFGSAVDSSGTVEHTFQIRNSGTADLNLTGTPKVVISGAAAGDFSVIAEPGSPVVPNTQTVFTIHFSPSAVGLRHATVSISNSDSAQNPYTFAIQGNGAPQPAPHIKVLGNGHIVADGDLTPSAADDTDFGSAVSSGSALNSSNSVNIGNTSVEHTFQIRNSGTSDLDLTGAPTVSISGAASGDFTVITQPGSPVAPHTETAFTIRFTPRAVGLRQATVSIANNDGSRDPYTYAIQGMGTAQSRPHMSVLGNAHTIANGDTLPSVADNTDFGGAVNGSGTVEHSFQIDNSGTADLNLTGTPKVTISGAAAGDFTVTVQPGSPVAPGTQTAFAVSFTPSAVGLRHATVTIHSDDSARDPYTFAIQGMGTAQPAPHMRVLGNAHSIANGDSVPGVADNTQFGTATINSGSVDHTFQIKNSGTADLAFNGTPKVSISGAAAGDFTVITQPGSPAAPNTQTAFTIRFSPAAAGLREATVSISNNEPGSDPYIFAIQGNGAAAPEAHMIVSGQNQDIANGDVTPDVGDNTDFGDVLLHDGFVEHAFQIINYGTADLTLSGTPMAAISGAAASDFSIKATPSSPVAPNTQTTFVIRFRPNLAGLREATVSIASSDSTRDPYTFAIQGTGTTEVNPSQLIYYLPTIFN